MTAQNLSRDSPFPSSSPSHPPTSFCLPVSLNLLLKGTDTTLNMSLCKEIKAGRHLFLVLRWWWFRKIAWFFCCHYGGENSLPGNAIYTHRLLTATYVRRRVFEGKSLQLFQIILLRMNKNLCSRLFLWYLDTEWSINITYIRSEIQLHFSGEKNIENIHGMRF